MAQSLRNARYTSRIIKAGALLPDTKLLLENWEEGADVRTNLDRVGRGLGEVPEEIRDAETWAHAKEYGPVFLELVWEGSIGGRAELIAAGVDFSLAAAPT